MIILLILIFENQKKVIYRHFDLYVSISSNNVMSNYVYNKVWGWYLRDYYQLLLPFFRDWYAFQISNELNEINSFGYILNPTLQNRKTNPEIIFITCFNTIFLKNWETLLKSEVLDNKFFYSDINNKQYINFLIKKATEKSILSISSQNIFNNYELCFINFNYFNSMNQADFFKLLSIHELYINSYKINSWIL